MTTDEFEEILRSRADAEFWGRWGTVRVETRAADGRLLDVLDLQPAATSPPVPSGGGGSPR